MQDRKTYILQKAFEVFMAKGYDSASMTVLQQEIKMSRGAMYRYFDSKDDLFKAVIDKYFFGLMDFMRPSLNNDMTVLMRIEESYQKIKNISKLLDKIEGIEVVFLNFTALIVQAAKRYPGFIEKMVVYREEGYRNWKKALENSIEKGEVRKDIDVKLMAKIFQKSFGANESDKPEKNFGKAAEEMKQMMNYIYSLIKA